MLYSFVYIWIVKSGIVLYILGGICTKSLQTRHTYTHQRLNLPYACDANYVLVMQPIAPQGDIIHDVTPFGLGHQLNMKMMFDRAFGPDNWEMMFPNAHLQVLHTMCSYLSMLLLLGLSKWCNTLGVGKFLWLTPSCVST